jgi:hypothetical protein
VTAKEVFLGRLLLGWSRARLAQESEVPVSEVYTFERIGKADPAAVVKIKAVLQVAGIEFISNENGGPGVRLRKTER